jgi:hypothetical protein
MVKGDQDAGLSHMGACSQASDANTRQYTHSMTVKIMQGSVPALGRDSMTMNEDKKVWKRTKNSDFQICKRY